MRKKIAVLVLAAVMAISMAMPAFAGTGSWQKDSQGWWYLLDDGHYYSHGWFWIDGMCYFFDRNGYCLMNTTTDDGYTVNEQGQWILGGKIQYQSDYQ